MTPIDIIETARLATYDVKVDQQTWEDKHYLMALNDARALLFSKFPESRVTAAVGLTAYSKIDESTLGDTMTEDDVYRPFFVEYLAYRFFDAGSRDTANLQKAEQHKRGYKDALSSLGGR